MKQLSHPGARSSSTVPHAPAYVQAYAQAYAPAYARAYLMPEAHAPVGR